MMKAMKLPLTFWAEAVRHAIYILNRVPTRALVDKTPYEALYNRKPNLEKLRIFECTAYAKITIPHLKKLDDRSIPLVYLGVEEGSKACRLYDPIAKKKHVSRDVKFMETKPWDWNKIQEPNLINDPNSPITPPTYTYNPHSEEEEEATTSSIENSEKGFDHVPVRVFLMSSITLLPPSMVCGDVHRGADDENNVETSKQVNLDSKSDVEGISETYFGEHDDNLGNDQDLIQPLNEKETSNDPFNIYDLLKKHNKGEVNSELDTSFPYPPGFTPEKDNLNIDVQEVKGTDQAKSQSRSEGLCSRILEETQSLDEHLSTKIRVNGHEQIKMLFYLGGSR
nr:zinc finger, CCHC-type [Tanacetum cinerariifolium]